MNQSTHAAHSPQLASLDGYSARRALFSILLLAAASVAHAQVASFDCGKASTRAEKAVCASPALGAKDVTLAAYFQLLLRLKPSAAGMAYREFDDMLRSDQRQWLKAREACEADAACLDRAYDHRIDTLLKLFDANAGLTFGRHIAD
ncbi:lysozyme inhibitor LprI family protein [Rhodanobacter sp. MP7CTX1]|jgi:uncharacterized protein|uniref:lysozyme inhibitor LprI family protein n=1 Tax=Rhodanobacter sp. MP7CTX1 TaxID=2723084 RepID=UPI00161A525C|nr:lysozyme inhibitor LprI family protein [Rhodanobacter sp. MP7CTX1]MBB6189126.1 uncharacterized protein [Rhodanobacter sp. MP7CTX1]